MPVAAFTVFAAEIKQGVGIESLIPFISGLFPLLIFLSSFVNKKAYWKITKFDVGCGLLSVLGLILWQVTKVGNIAIAFGILADGFALLPTFIKSYHYPETESVFPWFSSFLSAVIVFLAVQTWNFQTSAFPLYLVLANGIVFILVKYKLGKKLG